MDGRVWDEAAIRKDFAERLVKPRAAIRKRPEKDRALGKGGLFAIKPCRHRTNLLQRQKQFRDRLLFRRLWEEGDALIFPMVTPLR